MKKPILFFLLLTVVCGCSKNYVKENYPPLRSVGKIDLARYLGKWYEIARFPFFFEDGLVKTTATYSLKDNGKVLVLNEGYRDVTNAKKEAAVGEAFAPDTNRTAELKVSFFGPFAADYWVIALDGAGYQYAMVSTGYSYLWILSRKPKLDKDILDKLIGSAKQLGFDTEKLCFVPQDGE